LVPGHADGGSVAAITTTELSWLAIALIGAWTVLMCLKMLCAAMENAQARNQLKLDVLRRKIEMVASKRGKSGCTGNVPSPPPASWEESVEIVDEDEASSAKHKQAA